MKNNLPLKISNLVKNYGDFTAVNSVSFDVKPGEIFGLLGPNGAGKTSIISCLVTLQKPDSGEIEIFGYNPETKPVESKLLTGFVPQELMNHGYFDVEEILQFHSGYFRRWPNQERIHYLLNKVGLYEHRKKKVKSLSGGMKRRLLIAKALVHEPKLLLLDEPTAGVDIELRSALWTFVKELKSLGVSILLTTHYLEEAENLCDRVGILQGGSLRAVGETHSLIKKLTYRKLTIVWKNIPTQTQNDFLTQHKGKTSDYNIPYDLCIGDFLNNFKMTEIEDIKIAEGTLEEAVMSILGSKT